MFGSNPIRPPVFGKGDQLDVQEIFATLQGEGPYAGWPAVFVRLGGCNLACHFCDTEFESFTSWQTGDVLMEVERLARNEGGKRVRGLVVITGGEPFRQPIGTLCQALLDEGFMVQIETNGTIYREVPKDVAIICSPKVSGGVYHPIRSDLLQRLHCIKFIVSTSDAQYREVAEVGQTAHAVPVYVQPMDEGDAQKNADNLRHATAMALKHGYRLSVQLHKLAGIP